MTEVTKPTEDTVTAQVQAIINSIAGKDNNVFFHVRACRKQSSYMTRAGAETGMFQIDLWSLRYEHAPRAHMFRTTKQGVVPTEKISAFVTTRLHEKREAADRKASRDLVKNSNEPIAHQLRLSRKLKGDTTYYSEFAGRAEPSITADTGKDNTVRVSLPSLLLTEEQATQLFDLLDGFAGRRPLDGFKS